MMIEKQSGLRDPARGFNEVFFSHQKGQRGGGCAMAARRRECSAAINKA